MAKRRRKLRPIHLRIAKLRADRNLSQRELAAKLDVDETAISHWENGLSSPRGSRLEDVAKALGVSVPELFEAA